MLNVFKALISYCVLDSARSLGCNVDQSSKAPHISSVLPPGMTIEFCLRSTKEKGKAEDTQTFLVDMETQASAQHCSHVPVPKSLTIKK